MKTHKKTLFMRNANAIMRINMAGCYSADCPFQEGHIVGLECRCAESLEDLGRQLTKEAGTLRARKES